MMLAMYMSAMIRCVIALHNLINNKEIRCSHRAELLAAENELLNKTKSAEMSGVNGDTSSE